MLKPNHLGYQNKQGNRFGFFGNGWTKKEVEGEGDLTQYLKKPEDVDLRRYHEEWFEGFDFEKLVPEGE